MLFDLMAVKIRMSARVKILIDCDDQGETITADDFFGRERSLYLGEGIAVLEVSSAAGSLFVVTGRVSFLVAVDQHGVPVPG